MWPHNARGRRLYESGGFGDEGYLQRHYRRKSGALWDAVVMALILDRLSRASVDAGHACRSRDDGDIPVRQATVRQCHCEVLADFIGP